MTVVVGFPGSHEADGGDFVLLGADSEQGDGLSKSSISKIAEIERDDCKCLIAGAGNGVFIDLAVQEITAALRPNYTLVGVRKTMEDVVTDLFSNRIAGYPTDQQQHLDFDLLTAIWVKDEGVRLVRVGRGYNLVLNLPETIGVGSYLARYLISTYSFSGMDLYHTGRLTAYLLAQVKQHVPFCGGPSVVMALGTSGQIERMLPYTVRQHEQSADLVIQGAAKYLLHFVDPAGWRGDLDKVDEVVDKVSAQMKDDLRRRWRQPDTAQPGEASGDPTPTTPAASDPPPSPGSDESPQPPS